MKHINHRLKHENPVFTCVVDLSSEEPLGYWKMIDEEVKRLVETSSAKKNITITFPRRNRLEMDQSKHKIAIAVFWFYQEGYDLTTTKGKSVKEIVETNIEYILKEIPKIGVYIEKPDWLFPWEEIIDEFETLLEWLIISRKIEYQFSKHFQDFGSLRYKQK